MTRILEPMSKIKLNLGINENGRVQKFFTHECRRRMDKYVPYDTGMLRENVHEGVNYIEYKSPYAVYQYLGLSKSGKPLVYKTPGTGSYWDKKMWTAESGAVALAVQEYAERI